MPRVLGRVQPFVLASFSDRKILEILHPIVEYNLCNILKAKEIPNFAFLLFSEEKKTDI